MSASRIITGDCLSILPTLPNHSMNCCVTSPPYFGLRDYGHDGQIGLEPTPDEYVSKMVQVFREVHRVLRDDGTLWLNLGDSYNSPGPSNHGKSKEVHRGTGVDAWTQGIATKRVKGLKPKDLMGIPWRVAFALQADGWWLRQDIIWHKPNPMPESVTDRCTKAHEYIFLLSKSDRYYFDCESIKEESKSSSEGIRFGGSKYGDNNDPKHATKSGNVSKEYDKANKRSVWTVCTKPFRGAHFATFPPDLIYPCIMAGCPANGVVLDPFNGSGTTGMVALQNGRRYVGIELNPQYVALSMERMGVLSSLIEVTA
jgi:site-specific DNA-methyltransferase (adenine-specific)